jgi:hypothetical protein
MSLDQADQLMAGFAARTGLSSAHPVRRYLWTDAFAACNYLALYDQTADRTKLDLALRLVDQIHHTLGRHRADDRRRGWISGLADAAGEAHPTSGGLRIGKARPERGPAAPHHERLEWERDGQYLHYLTKWMHALDQVSRVTGEARYNLWACELAEAAWRAFVYTIAGGRRMYWKMSIDLTRPLVASMGQHDPLDGFLTGIELEATAADAGSRGPDLSVAIADYAQMLDLSALTTDDPLGIGGLFVDATRAAQLATRGALTRHPGLHAAIHEAAHTGLARYLSSPELRAPAAHRLAFRELGLAIGLTDTSHAAIGQHILAFWLDPANRANPTWTEHADINEVMLATCLVPHGFLHTFPFAAAGGADGAQ